MRCAIYSLVIVATLVASIASADVISGMRAPGTTIRKLTTDTFEHDTQMSSGSTTGAWFVMFSSPNCPVCVQFEPIWQKMADAFPEHTTNIAKVDCHSDEGYFLCRQFKVSRVPTLIYFNKGLMYPYTSERTFPALNEFMKSIVDGTGEPIPAPVGWMNEIEDGFKSLNFETAMELYEQQPYIVYFVVLSMVLSMMLILITILDACRSAKKPQAPAAAVGGKKAVAAPKKASAGGAAAAAAKKLD